MTILGSSPKKDPGLIYSNWYNNSRQTYEVPIYRIIQEVYLAAGTSQYWGSASWKAASRVRYRPFRLTRGYTR